MIASKPGAKAATRALFFGALCVAAYVFASPAQAMSARIDRGPGGAKVLKLSGIIKSSDFEAISTKLNSRGFREVWLDSPGGDVDTAYQLGREIRRLRFATRVPDGAMCMSACVDVFIGGVIRFSGEDSSIVVHPGSIAHKVEESMKGWVKNDKALEGMHLLEQNATASTAKWQRYLTTMGVSMDLVGFAAQVPHACGIKMRRVELIYYNVVNTAGPPQKNYLQKPPQKVCDPGS